ncbi:outer membrane lipoprotein-sorting protein [Psychromonas aquimarina]|uniref:outer membrane lipoprotein-sorting protein n=1 Tax=Psychromonas aquimarina TaxID=444919 RepID=UPI000425B3B6|nr:outer membrane lipoprotein-sorting protein [Psychromonas aquimarina]
MLYQGRLKTVLITTLLAAASLSSFAVSQQETDQEKNARRKGLDISVEVKNRDSGWGDSKADMLMILRNEQGQESVREIKIKSLEQLGDGDKSLTVFNKPKDVKGSAFLSYSHAEKADDQWLYLPSLKRVKRISSRNKSGPFMGSEFSFEDFSSFEVEKYSYKYLGNEKIAAKDFFKVEQFPVDENSGYTRRVVWIDQQEYLVHKIDYYDRKNSLLKTLTYVDYQQYSGKFWRARSMQMINHQNGKSTELIWNNYTFNNGLSEGDFNRNALKRTR